MFPNKKITVTILLAVSMGFVQSFAQKEHDHDEEKPKNLKVLSSNTSGREVHKIMKEYSRALGVRCGFCHVSEKMEGQERPRFDFASDNKPEKITSRNMMKMVSAINENYISKMIGGDHTLEQITCVTCHMGNKTPVVKVSDLRKDEKERDRD